MAEQLADLKTMLPWIVTRLSEMGHSRLFLDRPEEKLGKERREPSPEQASIPEAATAIARLPQLRDMQKVPSISQGGPVTSPSRRASSGHRDIVPQDNVQIRDAQSPHKSRSDTSEERPQTWPRQSTGNSNELRSNTSRAHVQSPQPQASRIELQPGKSKASRQTVPQESFTSPSRDAHSNDGAPPAVTVHNRHISDNLSTPRPRHIPSPASPAATAHDYNEVTYEVWSLVYGKVHVEDIDLPSSLYGIKTRIGAFTVTLTNKERVPGSYRFVQIQPHGLTHDEPVLRNSSSASVTQSIRILPLITQEAMEKLLRRRSFRKPSVAAVEVVKRSLWSMLIGKKNKRPSLTIYLACEADSPSLDSSRSQSEGSERKRRPSPEHGPLMVRRHRARAKHRPAGPSIVAHGMPGGLPHHSLHALPHPPPPRRSSSSWASSSERPPPAFSEEEAENMLENLLARLDDPQDQTEQENNDSI
ncbi:MAG: hypothetical protein Q9160_009326 [Pyrenula sp. 1 TL-2023]